MLLFMVRGLFSNLEFPYAHFSTRGISADSLFPLIWEAVYHLEMCGFNVIAFSCDGASPNRKFYHMHRAGKEQVYKTKNPFSDDHDIYFISDVPHLIKTTRNCWSNSFSHKNSRALWKDGKHISWDHLVRVYNRSKSSSGLSLLPKLKKDHIQLNSYSRMRVNLAAQVLSASVANALEYFDDDDATETVKFVRLFDRFFDCFNVRSMDESVKKRKPDLRPYRDPGDTRLSWLKDTFLQYLKDWEESVKSRKEFKPEQRAKMLLSTQTLEGIRITVKSFVELVPILLGIPGVQFVLSEKLNQDPVELFFGKQRAAGGRCDNPTVNQFCLNTVSLRLQGSSALDPIRGNCLRKRCSVDTLHEPLPKRARYSRKSNSK